jgi:hypothetical protein
MVLARQGDSRLCATLGVACDACKSRVRLHLLLEHVECDGDLHDTIHGATHWESLSGGATGSKVRSAHVDTDAAWTFVMPRALKVQVARDLARCAAPPSSNSTLHVHVC